MNGETTEYKAPFQLSHPVEGLHWLRMMLKGDTPTHEQVKGLLTIYDTLWAQSTAEMKARWAKTITVEFRPLVAELQVELRKNFLSSVAEGRGKGGDKEILEWRERLNHWIPDPFLKRDLWEIIHKSPYAMKVSHAIGLLYRVSGSAEELNRSRHEIRAGLLCRIYSTADDVDPVACGNAIRVLAIQASYEQSPESVDMVIGQMLKNGSLPVSKGGVVQLLREMYGEHRQVEPENQEGMSKSRGAGQSGEPGNGLVKLLTEMYTRSRSLWNGEEKLKSPDAGQPDRFQPGRFEEKYELMKKGKMYEGFPRIPKERLDHYRGQVIEAILKEMKSNPSAIGNNQLDLLRSMVHAISGKEFRNWQQRLDEGVYNYMNRPEVDVRQRARTYEFMAPYLTETTRTLMWKESILRSRMENKPAAAVTGQHSGRKESWETLLLKSMVNSAELQFLTKMMEGREAQSFLPDSVRMAVLERLAERTAELPWWKETPSRDLEHRLRIKIEMEKPPEERKAVVRETGGVSFKEWERYVAALPVLNNDTHNDLLIKALMEQADSSTERKVYRRMEQRGKYPWGFVKDNDPLVFHLVPRLEGVYGQPYFGVLFEKLARYGAMVPERYVPYLEQVGKILDRDELVTMVETKGVLKACQQNSSVAVTVIGCLNRFCEKGHDARVEACMQRIQAMLIESGHQTDRGQSPVAQQVSSAPVRHQVSSHQMRPPGGLTR